MSQQKSCNKKQRAHRLSEGKHGATKHPLSETEKALLGKGRVQAVTHVPLLKNWRGVGIVHSPWNAKNVAENRVLYPHLFMED